jgi:hypothetical protein
MKQKQDLFSNIIIKKIKIPIFKSVNIYRNIFVVI